MKIFLVLTQSKRGGVASVISEIANSLSEEHTIYVLAGKEDGSIWDMFNNNIKKITIPHLVRNISPINDFLALIELIKTYFFYKPDVIHLNSSKIGLLGRIAFPKKKTLYTVHGFDSIRIAYRKFLYLERLMQFRTCKIVSVSDYDTTNLKLEKIVKNVVTIKNGIKKPITLENDPFKEIKKQYNKVILTIARLAPPKNHELFIEISKQLPDYAFVWIGNTQEITFTHPKNTFFLGSIGNASSYIEFSDLFILCSDYEGLPMSIIEAMSVGSPIIASNVGGISEIVRNEENGFCVNNNPLEFVKYIKFILNKKEKYLEFSRKSKMIYEEELTSDQMVRRYLDVYQEIVK